MNNPQTQVTMTTRHRTKTSKTTKNTAQKTNKKVNQHGPHQKLGMRPFTSLITNNIGVNLRNKSWKPECVGSFNMDWRILVFYPEPEAKDKID